MIKKIKANTLLYVLILVNIALIMWVVVFNNSITITNNLNIWVNSEEVYRNIYNKWHIALESVKKFNSNGDGFSDIISCPTNVTMSGSTYKVTWITTQMAYKLGTIYCKWYYRGEEFRIYFNIDKTDYDSAYYKGDLVKLKYQSWSSTTELSTTNIWPQTFVTWTNDYYWNSKERAADNDMATEYISTAWNYYPYLNFDFLTSKNVWKIILKKDFNNVWWYRDRVRLRLYDDSGNLFYNKLINWIRRKTEIIFDIWVKWLTNKTKRIKISSRNTRRYMDMRDVYVYEYVTISWDPYWVWEREFNDIDSTLISFDKQGTGGWDKIDDNMNSDDYKWWSTDDWWVYINYAFWYEDDDIIPRKTFWGNVPINYNLYNIFWNNYKTNDFINNNSYNDSSYSEKISNVWTGYVHLDTYNTDNTGKSIFDLKIIKFDREKYKNLNTLLPIKSWEGKDIDNFIWYIQLSSTWSLSLSYYKTGNEFPFNFKDNDYAIFLTNKNESWDISYILTAETDSWTGIYINPINDSFTWTIEVMANHILMWWEKNFIWENFVVVWPK